MKPTPRCPTPASIALFPLLLALPLLAGAPLALATSQDEPRVAAVENAQVLRERFLELSRLYTTFEWTATEQNVFHGETPEGVWVDTSSTAHGASSKSSSRPRFRSDGLSMSPPCRRAAV